MLGLGWPALETGAPPWTLAHPEESLNPPCSRPLGPLALLIALAFAALAGAAHFAAAAAPAAPSSAALRASDAASDTALTTVFVVRHAEKNVVFAGADPPLSDAGRRRAQVLARVLRDANVKAILSTHFARTRETARPLADSTGDSITVVSQDDPDRLASEVWTHHRGEAVLIVGHSDTVPAIVRSLSGAQVPAYREGEFDRLYVITRRGSGPAALLRLRYGEGAAP